LFQTKLEHTTANRCSRTTNGNAQVEFWIWSPNLDCSIVRYRWSLRQENVRFVVFVPYSDIIDLVKLTIPSGILLYADCFVWQDCCYPKTNLSSRQSSFYFDGSIMNLAELH